MPKAVQIETEAEWDGIIQYLKTAVTPNDLPKSRLSNFKRRCHQFVVQDDPENPEKDALFLREKRNDDDPNAYQLKLFIPGFQIEKRKRIIAEFHEDKTGHGDYHKTYAQINEMHAGKHSII